MKLYEFSVTDEFNLSKSEIIKVAEQSASEEAKVQEWADFKVIECQNSERLASGEVRYYFEVVGAYAPTKNSEESGHKPKSNRSTDHAAAPVAPI